jgi:hypothetical protein
VLDQFDGTPHAADEAIEPECGAAIRRQCDELEADIKPLLNDSLGLQERHDWLRLLPDLSVKAKCSETYRRKHTIPSEWRL